MHLEKSSGPNEYSMVYIKSIKVLLKIKGWHKSINKKYRVWTMLTEKFVNNKFGEYYRNSYDGWRRRMTFWLFGSGRDCTEELIASKIKWLIQECRSQSPELPQKDSCLKGESRDPCKK